MLLISLKVLFLVLILYGCLDYSIPDEFSNFWFRTFEDRFSDITTQANILTLIVIILGIIKEAMKIKNKSTFVKSLKAIVAFVFSIQAANTAIYWLLRSTDIKNHQIKSQYGHSISISDFTVMCKHILPLIYLIIEILNVGLCLSRLCHVFNIIFGIEYFILARNFCEKYGEWPYLFLNRVNKINQNIFFAAIPIIACLSYEQLRLLRMIYREKTRLFSKIQISYQK